VQLIGFVVAGGIYLFFMDQIVRSMFPPVGMAMLETMPRLFHQLGWPYLKLCRTYLSVNLLHDINNNIVVKLGDSWSEFCSFVSSHTRQHSLSIFPLQSTINSLQYSFFVNIPFIWNRIPFNLLSMTDWNAFSCAVKCFWCYVTCFWCVYVSVLVVFYIFL